MLLLVVHNKLNIKLLLHCYMLCCPSPNLYIEGSDPPVFTPECQLLLTVCNQDNFDGVWRVHSEDRAKLFNTITRHRGDGKLVLRDILEFVKVQESCDIVRGYPSAIHGILKPSVVKDAFRQFDTDENDALDFGEWDGFLDNLETLHLSHLLNIEFQAFRAFFARGQPWAVDSSHPWADKSGEGYSKNALHRIRDTLVDAAGNSFSWNDPDESDNELVALVDELAHRGIKKVDRNTFQMNRDEDCVQSGFIDTFIPPGWFADFIYYSANNHPLHGIFSCDPNHQLSCLERIAMELATWGFSFYTVSLEHQWIVMGNAPLPWLENPTVFGIVFVTVPGMIVWRILFLLFTCPCASIDESMADRQEVRRSAHQRLCAAFLAYFLVVIGLCIVVLHAWVVMVRGKSNDLEHMPAVIAGRMRAYIIAWVTMFLIFFNPFIAWGQPNIDGPTSWGDYIGIGSWRIQKQRFQSLCLGAHDRIHDNIVKLHAENYLTTCVRFL